MRHETAFRDQSPTNPLYLILYICKPNKYSYRQYLRVSISPIITKNLRDTINLKRV